MECKEAIKTLREVLLGERTEPVPKNSVQIARAQERKMPAQEPMQIKPAAEPSIASANTSANTRANTSANTRSKTTARANTSASTWDSGSANTNAEARTNTSASTSANARATPTEGRQPAVPVTQDEDPQVSANGRWDFATRMPGETLRRSERVRSRNVADMAANETAEVPGLVLGATQRTSGYAAANRHLQMKEWAFEEYFAGAITCKETGAALEYRDLIKRPELREAWETSLANELGRLAQGIRDIKGTNTITFIKKSEIPLGRLRDVTYGRIVVSYRPQKSEPNRSRLTAGGDRINYPYEVSAPTCAMPTVKLHWNSVLSTPGAKYAVFDISNFYLGTKLPRPEFMRLPLDIFPQEIIDKYNLEEIAEEGWVYCRIDGGMYGLPQAGKIAHDTLVDRLWTAGYYPVQFTEGLWRHVWRPISFTLIVDDFGIKFVGKEHAIHLLNILQQ